MKTLKKIVVEVQAERPLSARQIQRHLKAAGIHPVGARQRPQQWPEDSAGRLLEYLGLGVICADCGKPRRARVLSLPEIRRTAKGAKR